MLTGKPKATGEGLLFWARSANVAGSQPDWLSPSVPGKSGRSLRVRGRHGGEHGANQVKSGRGQHKGVVFFFFFFF